MNRIPDAYPHRTGAASRRFAIAFSSVAVVFAISRFGGPMVDEGSTYLLLGTAVMVTAWFGGTGPALAATILGTMLGAAQVGDRADSGAAPLHLALFIAEGLILTAVMSELRAARRLSERQAEIACAAQHDGESAIRMKDEFLATVSHELRTPLNAVLGWVHLLRSGKLDQATAVRGFESVERNLRLQAQLTADLLDVSKALTGKLALDSRPSLLGDAARAGLASLESAAKAKGLNVTTSIADVGILGDPERLRQIAGHLLANAMKFTPRGGTIALTVEQVGDEAHLVVSDSGPGIDPQFLPRIFDRFTQADPSSTRAVGGLGVGLALVRELVELHGGEIDARNREGNAGAEFRARFPLQPAGAFEPQAARPALAAPVSSAPLDGVRVLVLDPDLEACEMVRAALQQRGVAVRTVGSVADALESLEGWRPDVLMTDRAFPDHDSYALVGKLRSLDADRGGRIPALALTTFARTDQEIGRMLADVQGEVTKPVEPALLTAEIARLTGRERRRAAR